MAAAQGKPAGGIGHDIDLLLAPITHEEEEFLNLVIVHYHTGWMLAGAAESTVAAPGSRSPYSTHCFPVGSTKSVG